MIFGHHCIRLGNAGVLQRNLQGGFLIYGGAGVGDRGVGAVDLRGEDPLLPVQRKRGAGGNAAHHYDSGNGDYKIAALGRGKKSVGMFHRNPSFCFSCPDHTGAT